MTNTEIKTSEPDITSTHQTDETSSDRTQIYNSVAKLREAFQTLSNGDEHTMKYFEQHARIIVSGVAHIADDRDEMFESIVNQT